MGFAFFTYRARCKLKHHHSSYQPSVAVLVPAFNEALIIEQTIKDLLELNYPKLEVIVIDDGSTDETFSLASAMADKDSRLKVFHVSHSKAAALNHGLTQTNAEIIVCTDADSKMSQDAISHAVKHFENTPLLAAIAGQLRTRKKVTILTYFQDMEYGLLNFSRYAQSSFRKVSLVPGSVGFFSHKILKEMGGFDSDTFAEDTDITIELLASGYDVIFEPNVIVWTEAPRTIQDLRKQRYRWYRGAMQVIKKRFKYENVTGLVPGIALLTLSIALLLPILVSLVLGVAGINIALSELSLCCEGSGLKALWLALFISEVFNQAVAISSLKFQMRSILLLPFKVLIYDPVRSIWAVKALVDERLGVKMNWNKVQRFRGN